MTRILCLMLLLALASPAQAHWRSRHITTWAEYRAARIEAIDFMRFKLCVIEGTRGRGGALRCALHHGSRW